MAYVKVVEGFVDLEANKARYVGEIIECNESRAKSLVGSGYCVKVKVEVAVDQPKKNKEEKGE